jgi:tetratricopeptide (TPR) repeat protein
VKTAEDHDLTFFSLRDLQQAISSKRVSRNDVLVQGAGRPRSLGSITELEPFFGGRASVPPTPTVRGQPAATDPMVFPKRARAWDAQDSVEPFAPSTSTPATNSNGPPTEKVGTLRPPPNAAAAPPPATLIYPRQARPLPPATVPVRRYDRSESIVDELGEVRPRLPSSEESYSMVPPRRRVGGWVVVLALLIAVAVVGWATVKPYFTVHESVAAAHLDARAQSFLADGESALGDGNMDVAQEDFDKASVLAEKDARVLLDQARLAAVKADLPWLNLRILSPEATDEIRMTRAQLDEATVRARRAADEAEAAASDDIAAIRAQIDALRLSGDLRAARADVPKILGRAAQPETAYVLAAIDLAEPDPSWATVIERLRLAVAGEVSAGRSRAALIYALARSGDEDGARSELVKLDALPRPFPLLPALHGFVERSTPKASATATSAEASGHPLAAGPPARPAAAALAPATTETISDPRTAMQAAAQALRKADYPRARQIYGSIVDRNPNDSEALSGLGDVSRQQGNLGAAIADYRRAIAVNPSYLPALLGLADTEWASGDRAKASHDYGDIVDRFPEGTYPSYVSKRVPNAAAPPTADPGGATDGR